jgi:SOS-response transcriptional repressor LexA
MFDMSQSLAVIEPPSQAFCYCSISDIKAVTIPLMRNEVILRIEQRLKELGLSAKGASEKAGLSKDAIRNWQRKPDLMPTMRSIAALAVVLQTTVNWLIGETDDQHLPDTIPFGVRFGGVVEAGTFRPQNDLSQDDDYRLIALPHDARYPAAAQYAFSVMGDSMTRERIFEGMHVLGVDLLVWERLHGAPRDGQLVVVARTRNSHPERELTVKKLRIFTDRLELQPCSDNPGYSPLVFPLPLQEDAMDDACIIAVVLSATWIYG